MSIESKPMKKLLELHNSLAPKPAGPKTFSTKAKLLDRIRALRATQVVAKKSPKYKPKAAEKKETGFGVGELARSLLMHPAGYTHALIAAMVNEQISGAKATDKSVRWYACELRKRGVEVPERARVHVTDMNTAQSAEWLASVRVRN